MLIKGLTLVTYTILVLHTPRYTIWCHPKGKYHHLVLYKVILLHPSPTYHPHVQISQAKLISAVASWAAANRYCCPEIGLPTPACQLPARLKARADPARRSWAWASHLHQILPLLARICQPVQAFRQW